MLPWSLGHASGLVTAVGNMVHFGLWWCDSQRSLVNNKKEIWQCPPEGHREMLGCGKGLVMY